MFVEQLSDRQLFKELSIYLSRTSVSVRHDGPTSLQYDTNEFRKHPKTQASVGSDLQPFLFPTVALPTDKAHISINLSTEPLIMTKLVLSLRNLGSFADNRRQA